MYSRNRTMITEFVLDITFLILLLLFAYHILQPTFTMDRRGRGRGGGTPYGHQVFNSRILHPIQPYPSESTDAPKHASTENENDLQDANSNPQDQPLNTEAFGATLDEVKMAKQLLLRRRLPLEIVNIIMDKAEYWASTRTSVDYRDYAARHFSISGGVHAEDKFLLRCKPIGLTQWTPPGQDSPSVTSWHEPATPKLVLKDDSGQRNIQISQDVSITNLSPELSSSDEDKADFLPSSSEMTESQVDFDKAILEKHTNISVPTLVNPVRKIVFDIVSADQGHAPYNREIRAGATYDDSNTWFDAGVDRFDKSIQCPKNCPDRQDQDNSFGSLQPCMIRPVWPPSKPNAWASSSKNITQRRIMNNNEGPYTYDHALHPDGRHLIQKNRRAQHGYQHHHIEWSWLDEAASAETSKEDMGFIGRPPSGNGDFVRRLRLGDMVTVWGRARYTGWINHVQRIEVRIYYAI